MVKLSRFPGSELNIKVCNSQYAVLEQVMDPDRELQCGAAIGERG